MRISRNRSIQPGKLVFVALFFCPPVQYVAWMRDVLFIHRHKVALQLLTCLRIISLPADKHVTRYLVRLRNELSTSSVKCSRDDRWSINDITRNPRFCFGVKRNTWWTEIESILNQGVKVNVGCFEAIRFFLPGSYAAVLFASSPLIRK